MFITAEIPWGRGCARRRGPQVCVPDVRSSSPGQEGWGILTGVRILACINLVKVDGKVRTKLMCLRDFLGSILTSSVLCFE